MATPIPANRVVFTPWEVAAITGGRLVLQGERRAMLGLTSDSRTATEGAGFIALRGEAYDGHDFVDAALGRGVSTLVIERGRKPPDSAASVIEVDDTLVAWGKLGQAHLRRWRRGRPPNAPGRVVAITGSAGKTTTKDLCATLLRTVARCHATAGNLNNCVGVPAVALGLEREHRFAVFELGMNAPGEIRALAEIVAPDVGVIVNIGLAHAAGVGGTRSDVAREKGAIFEALGEAGVAIVNLDDAPSCAQLLRTSAVDRRGFGQGEADYRLIERRSLGIRGSHIILERPDLRHPKPHPREQVEVALPIIGEAAAVDFLAALAAAEAAVGRSIPVDGIRAALSEHVGVAGRALVRELAGDVLVIDDSYNANPASMRAALAALCEVAQSSQRRKVAVLGEMRELGPLEHAEHVMLGEEMAKAGVSLVIGCGGLIDLTLDHAARHGVTVVKARNTEDAARVTPTHVRDRDVVLFKGSRGVAVEKVLDGLLQARGVPKDSRIAAPADHGPGNEGAS